MIEILLKSIIIFLLITLIITHTERTPKPQPPAALEESSLSGKP